MTLVKTLKIGCAVATALLCVSVIGFCYPSEEERTLKKLERTLSWMRNINTTWQGYSHDQRGRRTAAHTEDTENAEQLDWQATGVSVSFSELESILVPEYARAGRMHSQDAWGHPFEFRLVGTDLAIRSSGRDGFFSKQAYIPCVFEINDVSQDIVLWGGKFKRHPLLPLVEDSLLDEHMVRQAEKRRAQLRRCD